MSKLRWAYTTGEDKGNFKEQNADSIVKNDFMFNLATTVKGRTWTIRYDGGYAHEFTEAYQYFKVDGFGLKKAAVLSESARCSIDFTLDGYVLSGKTTTCHGKALKWKFVAPPALEKPRDTPTMPGGSDMAWDREVKPEMAVY